MSHTLVESLEEEIQTLRADLDSMMAERNQLQGIIDHLREHQRELDEAHARLASAFRVYRGAYGPSIGNDFSTTDIINWAASMLIRVKKLNDDGDISIEAGP